MKTNTICADTTTTSNPTDRPSNARQPSRFSARPIRLFADQLNKTDHKDCHAKDHHAPDIKVQPKDLLAELWVCRRLECRLTALLVEVGIDVQHGLPDRHGHAHDSRYQADTIISRFGPKRHVHRRADGNADHGDALQKAERAGKLTIRELINE